MDDFLATSEVLDANRNFMTQRAAVGRSLAPDAGRQASILARDYPGLTPDTTAALGMMQFNADNPQIASIIRRDYAERGWVEKIANQTIGRVTRPLTAAFYDAWDTLWPHGLRTLVQSYQNPEDSLKESYLKGGTGISGASVEALQEGTTTVGKLAFGGGLGTGLIAGRPDNPLEMPGAGRHFENLLKQGASLDEAQTETEQWVMERYGADVVNRAWEVADATRLHVTVDGVEYDYGVSMGRMAVTPFFQMEILTPHTVPANIISGGIDATTQVVMDPLDPLFNAATSLYSVRKALHPTTLSSVDEAIAANGGIKITDTPIYGPYHDGVQMPGVEGYVFHGSSATDGVDLAQGGISQSLERARGYAGADGVVYAIKKTDLPEHIQKHIEDVGEVEQFVNTRDITPEQMDNVGYWMEQMESANEDIVVASTRAEEIETVILEGNPEYRQAMDEWERAFEEGERPFETLEDIASTHMTEEEYYEFTRSLEDLDEVKRLAHETHVDMQSASSPIERAMIAEQQVGPRNLVEGKFDLPAEVAPIASGDVDTMMQQGYFFPDGKGAMDGAYRYTDQELQIGKSHGRFSAQSPEEFLGGKRGQSLVAWLSDGSVSFEAKFRKMRATGVPAAQVVNMIEEGASNPIRVSEYLEEWINGRVLRQQVTAPTGYRMLGATPGSVDLLAGTVRASKPARRFNDWGRRWGAHSTTSKIDMWDPDATFDSISQFLRTIGASQARIDEILEFAISRESVGNYYRAQEIAGMLVDELKVSLIDQGLEEPEVVKIINDYFEEQHKSTLYNLDRAGHPIGETDSMFTVHQTPGGLEYKVLVDQPILDSELSMSSVQIPSIREARRVTANTRKIANKVAKHPLGLKPTIVNRMTDTVAATWRNFQLLRPGWIMSVIPDEMLRGIAEGHTDLLSQPSFVWNLMINGAGDLLPSGSTLDALAQASGGYGTGAFARSSADEALSQAAGAKAASWQVVDVTDAAGNVTLTGGKQVARNWIRIYQSQLFQALYQWDNSIDDTVDFLVDTPAGRQVVDDILGGAGTGAVPAPDRRLAQIDWRNADEARKALKVNLEAIEGHVLLLTGGDYVKRGPDGGWVSSAGVRVEDYSGQNQMTGRIWTRADIIGEIQRMDPNARNLGRKNLAELKSQAMELGPVSTDLSTVPANQGYVKIKDGDYQIRNMLGGGTLEREPMLMGTAIRHALLDEVDNLGLKNGNVVYLVADDVDEAGMIPDSFELYKDPGEASRTARSGKKNVIVVNMDELDDVAQARVLEELPVQGAGLNDVDYTPSMMTTYSADELERLAQDMIDQGNERRIFDNMEVEDLEELIEFAQTRAYTEEFPPPRVLKGPASVVGERLDGLDGYIDQAFSMLGSQPSVVMARHPYASVRTWETFADYSLYATPQVRTQIAAAARRSGIQNFSDYLERSMRLQGLSEMPLPAVQQLSIDEIEKIAVATAIQDTRDLFFDLSKRGNWADASKLIFPFADAWWEVLTRWGRLFNPVKTQEFGKPFRNMRRLQQGIMGAERSGWFETNERGERVFRFFPGAAMATALMDTPSGFNMTNQASMNQLGFIDFSDTRAILGPGMGPYMQAAAALVRPLTENMGIQSAVDWAVYGSYSPTEVDAEGIIDMLFPTYLRKLFYQVSAGEYDERFASMQIEIANGLYASGDPRWADLATNQATLNRLMKESQEITSTYGWVDVLVSWVAPLQPRAVVEMVNTEDDGAEQIVQLMSVADDYRFLLEYFEREQALATIVDWYGHDPLMIGQKSYGVLNRPITEGGYDFSLEYPDALLEMPYTVAAWMPVDPIERFYSPEYQRQIAEGDRQKLTASESMQLLSYKQGQSRITAVQDERDRRLLEAETMWGKDSDMYRSYRDDVAGVWYANAKRALEAQYFGFSTGSGGPTGIRKRPTYTDMRDEMLALGTPGSPVYGMARDIDPLLSDALEELARVWNHYTNMSISMGHDGDWWYGGTATTNMDSATLRSGFQKQIFDLTTRLDEDTQHKFKWYTDFVVTPLMTGYSLDNPFVVDVDPLLAPEA